MIFEKKYKWLMTGALCAVLLAPLPAQAQQAGCDTGFLDLEKALSAVSVAIDNAAGVEVLKKPPSVFILSCFQEAIARSADAGQIFSDTPTGSSSLGQTLNTNSNTGSLYSTLDRVVGVNVENWVQDNYTVPGEMSSGFSNFGSSVLNTILSSLGSSIASFLGYNPPASNPCTTQDALRNQELRQRGLNLGAPSITLDDAMTGGFGGGANFQTSMNAGPSANARNNARTGLQGVTEGNTPYFQEYPNMAGQNIQQIRNYLCGGPCP